MPSLTDPLEPPFSEFIARDTDRQLRIEGLKARDIAEKYGTPLYVTSENQIRTNYRRLYRAFSERYSDVTILYANKANSNIAVRTILTEEGAGGDCFGVGEMTVSIQAGTSPAKMILNGSNKSIEDLLAAAKSGIAINLDHPDDLKRVESIAETTGEVCRVLLRILPFSTLDGAEKGLELRALKADKSDGKWGMDRSTTYEVLDQALKSKKVRVCGLHMHVSRLVATTEYFELGCQELIGWMVDIKRHFGWVPEIIDIGGGIPHGRDPEGQMPADNRPVASVEDFAEVTTQVLKKGLLANDLGQPRLWIEPGRSLISNATVLLTTVGVVKKLPSSTVTWVNVDGSTSHCLRASLEGYHYEIVHVEDTGRPGCVANIVGPTCTSDILGEHRMLHRPERGDLLAVLDVGGYAEALSTQFNMLPRPASVLVKGTRSDVIRHRETIGDLLAGQHLPAWLAAT